MNKRVCFRIGFASAIKDDVNQAGRLIGWLHHNECFVRSVDLVERPRPDRPAARHMAAMSKFTYCDEPRSRNDKVGDWGDCCEATMQAFCARVINQPVYHSLTLSCGREACQRSLPFCNRHRMCVFRRTPAVSRSEPCTMDQRTSGGPAEIAARTCLAAIEGRHDKVCATVLAMVQVVSIGLKSACSLMSYAVDLLGMICIGLAQMDEHLCNSKWLKLQQQKPSGGRTRAPVSNDPTNSVCHRSLPLSDLFELRLLHVFDRNVLGKVSSSYGNGHESGEERNADKTLLAVHDSFDSCARNTTEVVNRHADTFTTLRFVANRKQGAPRSCTRMTCSPSDRPRHRVNRLAWRSVNHHRSNTFYTKAMP